MKKVFLLYLLIYPIQSTAISFIVCVSETGQRHITNLPREVFNPDCTLIDDYRNYMLQNEYKKMYYNLDQNQLSRIEDESEKLRVKILEIKEKLGDLFDPDKALENLIEKSSQRDDIITRYLKRQTLLEDLIRQLKE